MSSCGVSFSKSVMEKVFGNEGSDIGRFSLSESFSREPDRVGAEDCLSTRRTILTGT